MQTIPLDMRRRAVTAYEEGLAGTHDATAKIFGIGVSTLGKLLRRYRSRVRARAVVAAIESPFRFSLEERGALGGAPSAGHSIVMFVTVSAIRRAIAWNRAGDRKPVLVLGKAPV